MRKYTIILLLVLSLSVQSASAQTAIDDQIRQQLNTAAVYKEVMEYDKAIAALVTIPEAQSTDEVRKYLGRLYYLNGQTEKALALYERITAKDWITYAYLGLMHEEETDTRRAIESYQKSLALRVNSIALFRLGKLSYEDRNYAVANRYFTQLGTFDPSIRVVVLYLGECLLKLGNYKDAYKYYAKSINFYPQNKEVKDQLSMVKRKLGDKLLLQLKSVVEETRKAVKLAFYTREKDAPMIKIGIATGLSEVSFRCPGSFQINSPASTTCKANTVYTLTQHKGALQLREKDSNKLIGTYKKKLSIKGDGHPFYLYDVLYGKGDFWHKKIDRGYRGDFTVTVEQAGITLVNEVSIEEYLYGVLAAEISPNAGTQALRSQAIAARSLAFNSLGKRHKKEGFDVCADVHCQVYQGISVETPQTIQAVKDTRGQVLNFNNQPIEAFYHSNCGGCLRSNVFGGKIPYLETHFDSDQKNIPCKSTTDGGPYQDELWFTGYDDAYCMDQSKSNYRWQRIYDAKDFLTSFGFALKDIKSIVPIEKDDCFHYATVKVVLKRSSKLLTTDSQIRNFFDRLRSSACRFEIRYSTTKEPTMLVIWGAGFGHGGGMCQEGASVMAKKGFTYQEILKHYYPKTEIRTLY